MLFQWFRKLRDWIIRNVYYTYDFEANENLSHKQSILFYGHPRMFFRNLCYLADWIIFDNIESNQCTHQLHEHSWSSFPAGLQRFLFRGIQTLTNQWMAHQYKNPTVVARFVYASSITADKSFQKPRLKNEDLSLEW